MFQIGPLSVAIGSLTMRAPHSPSDADSKGKGSVSVAAALDSPAVAGIIFMVIGWANVIIAMNVNKFLHPQEQSMSQILHGINRSFATDESPTRHWASLLGVTLDEKDQAITFPDAIKTSKGLQEIVKCYDWKKKFVHSLRALKDSDAGELGVLHTLLVESLTTSQVLEKLKILDPEFQSCEVLDFQGDGIFPCPEVHGASVLPDESPKDAVNLDFDDIPLSKEVHLADNIVQGTSLNFSQAKTVQWKNQSVRIAVVYVMPSM